MNEKYNGNYLIEYAEKATGAQGLKVATIYNKKDYTLLKTDPLIFKKGNNDVQFGFIISF
jgi:hypothetical protein